MKQQLSLKTMPNLRDFSAYKTTDGKRIKPKTLYRSECPQGASEQDFKALFSTNGLNIGAVIDLRNSYEITRDQYKIENPAVNYTHIDIADIEYLKTIFFTKGMDGFFELHDTQGFDKAVLELYAQYASNAHIKNMLRQFFDILLSPKTNIALFHCVSGKDRTGMASVILMMMLGFSRSDIITDYLLSNVKLLSQNLEKFEKARKAGKDSEYVKKLQRITIVNPQNLTVFWEAMQKQYPTEQAFFDSFGMTGQKIEQLKQKYLTSN